MQIYGDKKFNKPLCVLKAFNKDDFKRVFELLDDYRKDYYILGYVRYEAKDIFAGKEHQSPLPLCYFEVFDEFETYIPENTPPQYLSVRPKISQNTYFDVIFSIKNYIAEGFTYEVNYTYPNNVKSYCSDIKLYESLLTRQKTPYNAFIQNEYETVLSFSPELFFRLDSEKIITKPMKGTIERGLTLSEDESNIAFLRNDEKNRAENVMIVDLLRNDLGRIAETGSVSVDKLFEVETHTTVHQMTSEISAKINTRTLYDIFEALFPCGSITGAPKLKTMEIIEALECERRHIYCGAIGYMSPDECVFSVPIRILQKRADEKNFTYNVGGAIVWDSTAEDEWAETIAKKKFLEFPQDFALIETMKVQNNEILFEREHIDRLKNSANTLGFSFPVDIDFSDKKEGMLRLLLHKDGTYQKEYLPLKEAETNLIKIADPPADSKELFLHHKTTYRPWYEKSFDKIKNGEVYDEIFFNERLELTEGARSNIILKIGNKLYTPPLTCGILNGIYRSMLIKSGECEEKVLYLDDLKKANAIYAVNSVRGMVEVRLV